MNINSISIICSVEMCHENHNLLFLMVTESQVLLMLMCVWHILVIEGTAKCQRLVKLKAFFFSPLKLTDSTQRFMEFKLRSPYAGPTHILKPNSNMLPCWLRG